MQTIDSNALFKENCLLRLKCSKWGNSAKGQLSDEAVLKIIGPAPPDMTEEDQRKRTAAAKKRLGLNVKLLESPEFIRLADFINEARSRIIRRWCVPSYLDDGLYLCRTAQVEQVVNAVETAQKTIANELVPAFVDRAAAQIEEARQALGDAFKAKDYPDLSTMSKRFGISHRFIRLTVAEGLPPEIREQEEAKLRQSFAEAQSSIVSMLWMEFDKCINHIVERLQPTEDGKRKKFESSLFNNLIEYIETFSNRNMMDDGMLAALVTKAKSIMETSGWNGKPLVEQVKTFSGLRKDVEEKFSAIKAEVAKGISDLPARGFSFDDE